MVLIIVYLNVKLVYNEILNWFATILNPLILWITVVPLALGFLVSLLYIAFNPLINKTIRKIKNHSPHRLELNFSILETKKNQHIAIAVDFSTADSKAINSALKLGGTKTNFTFMNVLETLGALMYGNNIEDHETTIDAILLPEYKEIITQEGFKVKTKLGYGKPQRVIPEIINNGKFDILVIGTHGRLGFKDLIFGTTEDKLRQEISIPLYIIKN